MNRAVFLDRDGTITKSSGLVTNPDELVLEESAAAGIKILNDIGFKVVVITNQPQVARGMISEEGVIKLNEKMLGDLKKKGALVDAVYFCPHHPEMHADVPEHAKKYRIVCECRKPGIGMLKQAQKDLNIDLKKSYVVGDRTVDIKAGANAGATTILVRTGEAGKDGKCETKHDHEAENLLEAAKLIRQHEYGRPKAVILAGGRGERLRPLTDTVPKPMIEIGGKPAVQHQIEMLRGHGITDIVICGSYLVDKLKEYFGNGSKFGVNIRYTNEPQPMGTGGALKLAKDLIGESEFIVLNGDVMMSGIDFASFIKFHKKKGGFATILVRESDHPKDSDAVQLDSESRVVNFIGHGQEKIITTNVGMAIAGPELLAHIPDGVSNVEKDVIFKLIRDERIYGFMMPQGWFVKDFGTPERLGKVRAHFTHD